VRIEREYHRKYRAENKDKIREYLLKNQEKIKKYKHEYYLRRKGEHL